MPLRANDKCRKQSGVEHIYELLGEILFVFTRLHVFMCKAVICDGRVT